MQTNHRLVLVVLYVSDLEASLKVYRDVFRVPLAPSEHDPPDDPWVGGQHAALSWHDGADLHFALYPARPPDRPVTSGAQVGFRVADALDTHSRAVSSGVKVLHEPRTEPWGLTARYLDPDRNIINVTSPVGARVGCRPTRRCS